MSRLTLTLATTEYDHTRDLVTGDVAIEGIDPIWLQLRVEEIFHRFVLHREWDVSEISFAKYAALIASGDESLVGIPVFLSRMFRHSSIFVRADSGLCRAEELAGRRIGVPEWAQTASVYTRGCLQDQYGVDLRGVQWFQAGVNQAGRREKVKVSLPEGISCTRVQDRTLNGMLLDGEIDAVLSARPPTASAPSDGRLTRLFDDSRAEERKYFAQTGVFPIMHTIVIRREVADRYPWVATTLYKAFCQARDNSVARLMDGAVARVPVPWFRELALEAWEMIGGQPWPYGIEANIATLDTFLEYAYEQGVCERRLAPKDLFAPQVDGGFIA
jgi:4,5-dihydroxyphthalate decarboxylase